MSGDPPDAPPEPGRHRRRSRRPTAPDPRKEPAMSPFTAPSRAASRRMRAAVAALVVLAGLAFATTVNAARLPSFTPLLGCTVNWDGGAGTSRWHDAANWDTDMLPGSSDRVCIPASAPGTTVVV